MRRVSLLVLQGPDRGRIFEIAAPGGTIGRAAANAIVLTDPTVSRVQAKLVINNQEALLIVRPGKNPVFVNERRVDDEARLRPADRITMGATVLAVGTPADDRAPESLALPASGSTSTLALPVRELDGARFLGIVGTSEALTRAEEAIARVAPTEATVLLVGESGTGKELAARAIHMNSPRARRPFVVVDGGALPATLVEAELFGNDRGAFTGADGPRAGRFEMAQGGTIFLDEIGELPLESQPKLLRVLEERRIRRVGGTREIEVDVRVVAATNRDLEAMVREGRFRADLYYRLAVVQISLPPLRERLEDIPDLVRHFCARFGGDGGRSIEAIEDAAIEILRAQPWPGNIRQLRNAVRTALVLGEGPVLRASDFPPFVAAGGGAPPTAAEATAPVALPLRDEADERRRIEDALRLAQGNKSRAATLLGIGRTTLYEKMKKLGIPPAKGAAGD